MRPPHGTLAGPMLSTDIIACLDVPSCFPHMCRWSRSASSSQQLQQQQRLTSAGSTGSGGLISVGGGSGIISHSSSGLWSLQQQQQQQDGFGSSSYATANGKQRRPSSGSSTPQRWQEQNKVGGGSLYGVSDTTVAAATAGSTAKREAVAGVDLVYLRNVVLKFLEAVMAGKTTERDALLPAVAAVLQATPAEFAAMRKVLAATAPPATQVLSVLGRLAQLTG